MPLLEVTSLTKRFGGLVANDEVTFSLEAGSIVGLIGPNGAGKTTLFNCISGHYSIDQGRIRFEGREIGHLPAEERCQLGIARTFQVVRTFRAMTVLENVMIGCFVHTKSVRAARDEAMTLLEMTGLVSKAKVKGAGLTLANKKRLEMARALGTHPKLVMLDEAMAGLNTTETREAIEIVKAVRASGITVLLVEHVMEAVMPICDNIIVLNYGKKIAEGTPASVTRNEDVVRAYLGVDYYAAG